MADNDTNQSDVQADRDKVRSIVDKARFTMLTSTDREGALVSRPMTVQEIRDDWSVVFVTQRSTDVAQQSAGKSVNLAFANDGDFVSVSGTGEVVNDDETLKRLWNAANEAFTEGGPEDPDNVLLVVHGQSAEYWSSAAKPKAAVSMLRAALTGDKPEGIGESGTVELH